MATAFLKDREKITRLTFPGSLAAIVLWLPFFYYNTMGNLWHAWQAEEYSHAPLLVAIALLWGLRLFQSKIKEPARPSRLGLGLLFFGFALALVSKAASNNWFEQIALVFSICGVVGLFWGRKTLGILLPPLGLLFLTIPLPQTISPVFTAKMQLLSSDLGVAGLHFLGISAFQEGNVIDIGAHKLYVAEACSGLRYVFPLISIGYLVAFHAYESTLKRVLLILSTFPIALLSNGLRITATGIIADRFGIKFVEGSLHDFEGFAVFAFCLICFGIVHALLNLVWPETDKAPAQLLPACPSFSLRGLPRLPVSFVAGLVLLICLSGFGLSALQRDRQAPPAQREAFITFPLRLGAWRGMMERLSEEELGSLQLDDYLLVRFLPDTPELPPINLYAAYYASQEQGRAIHSPEICLPGAGWEIVSRTVHALDVKDSSGKPMRVTRELVSKDKTRQLVYYWFNQGGINAPTNWRGKINLLRNAFSSGRTDGSLWRVAMPIGAEQNPEEADKILESFLKEALPLLPRYAP